MQLLGSTQDLASWGCGLLIKNKHYDWHASNKLFILLQKILQMFWLFPSNTEDFNLKGLHQTLKIFPKAFLSDIFFQQTLILKVYQKKFTKSQSGNSLSSC